MKKLLLILIIFLACFLRLYKLGDVPAGLTNDEASLGYDAYSVMQTGKDQWGVFLPLNFKEFGDYRLPAYIYLSLIPIKIFDLNEFSIRLPSAIFGVFSTIILYFLVKKILDDKKALFISFLFAISPWSIGLSRVALEPNIAITFFLLGLLFFVYFLHQKKKGYLFYLSILFFTLTFYTYSAYTLFTPLTFIIIVCFYRKFLLTSKKQILIGFLFFIFLFAPLILNSKLTAGVRFSQVGIINNVNSIGLVNTLNSKRGACIKDFPSIICKLSENKIVLFSNNFIQNYISHFSFDFLYNTGTPTQYSILPERGLEFLFEAFILIFGIIWLILKRNKESLLLLSILLISPIPDSLTGDGHYARASLMSPFIVIIEGLGLAYFIGLMQKIKVDIIKYFALSSSFIIVIFSLSTFFVNYLTYYKEYYSTYSHYGYRSLMEKVFSQKGNFDEIYISRRYNDTKQYIFYLFFNKYDPQKYQSKGNVSFHKADDGWMSIDKIDNVYFGDTLPILSKIAIPNNKVLLISSPSEFANQAETEIFAKDFFGNKIFIGKKIFY